jgi:type IV secretory pathway TrbD component
MNEQQLGFRIGRALDQGLGLSPEIVGRLRVARERALDAQRVPARQLVLAGAGRTGAARPNDPRESWVQTILPVAILIAALFGLHHWQASREAAQAVAQRTAEFVEVDTAVLTGELPIDAYLDEEFQEWLRTFSD